MYNYQTEILVKSMVKSAENPKIWNVCTIFGVGDPHKLLLEFPIIFTNYPHHVPHYTSVLTTLLPTISLQEYPISVISMHTFTISSMPWMLYWNVFNYVLCTILCVLLERVCWHYAGIICLHVMPCWCI